jgi:hypothetical protein
MGPQRTSGRPRQSVLNGRASARALGARSALNSGLGQAVNVESLIADAFDRLVALLYRHVL